MKINNHKRNGVYIELSDEVKLSCVYGKSTYSDNRDLEGDYEEEAPPSKTIEVMVTAPEKLHKKIFKKYEEFDTGDNILAYLPLNDYLQVVEMCRKYVVKHEKR